MDDNKTIEKVIVVSSKKNFKLNIANVINNCWSLEEFLDSGRNLDGTIPDLEFEQLPFMTPVFFIFTSGSTGLPKGVIHSAGVFLTFFRDVGLQCNLGRDDVILQEYCVGWATWNLLVSSLGLGVTLLLNDNGKCFSYSHHFWDIVDKLKVSFLFFSPKVLDTLVRNSIVPSPDVTLDHLKIILVGGSLVALKPFDYILKNVKSDVFVGTLYGQSETLMTSGFYLNTPVYSAEIQCAALGVDLKVLDSQGNNLIGKPGELVVSSPTPSMALKLWNDLDGQRFNDTYLSKFSGTWALNDEGYVDPNTEGIIVIGRSDSVLCYFDGKFGSGEIYWAIDDIEEIEDSICVSQRNNIGDIQFVLFVRMKKDHVFNQKLVKKIQKNIIEKLMPSRVPKVILPIKDIPYNINGKKMEPLVREILLTNQVPPAGNIRNPECLLEYCNIPEILKFAASGK